MIDNGMGIKLEDQKKLFKLYGFLETSKEVNSEGIGLGLYISKKITNKFGGNIDVKSKPGEGSTFTFSFMLDKVDDE